jgi:hypothetical protein
MISPQPHRKTRSKSRWRIAFRLDLRRALIAISGVTATLALAFFLASHEKPEKPAEVVLRRELRTGSILFMPLVGDVCRQSVFDNDTGLIWSIDSVSCEKIKRNTVKSATENSGSHVMAISDNFRK